jgi:hypothetical protein
MDQANISQVSPKTGTGYLVFAVTTARGAIPLEGARVDVRTYESEGSSDPSTRGDTVASLISGRDGNTARIPLSAPPKSYSSAPGNGKPYSLYQAEVTLDGYYRQTYTAIPVFDEITAIQPVSLIPLPENGTVALPRPDENRFFEGGSPNL